ncbi:MAG: hypothetical protein ACRECJ_10870 [Limisphaerales bacterium]
MKSRRPEMFERLAGQSEEFLFGWAEKEKKGLSTFKRIWRLKELAYRPIEEFPDLAERFRLFEEWLGSEGMELAASPLTRYQMEEISAALEKLKLFLPRNGESAGGASSSDQLSELAEKFVARLSGREAKPPTFSAKSAAPASSNPSAELRVFDDRRSGDLSEDFQKLLSYELEYMRQYRKPGEHPLSVIGRLLDALNARYHLADEVFVAHLLYFLQAQNYPVGPYLEKFRQVKGRVKK